jgi:hypothetical protein
MANEEVDIFKSLKNFHIGPPKNLFKKIWCALGHSDKSTELLSSSSLQQVQKIGLNEGYSDMEIEIFKSLQDHSITPPAFSSLKISSAVSEVPQINLSKKITPVIGLKYIGRIAAAVLILACSIWTIYYATHKKQESIPVVLNNQKINSSIAANVSIQNGSKQTGTLVAKRVNKNIAITRLSNTGKPSCSRQINSGTKLEDNDVLLTLVSYRYKEYAPLMKQIEKNNKITIDQFSYINISDKMNSILSKMYATKRNNKSTRKAKKLRNRLDRWEKSDEKYFDTDVKKNPIDIVDLSEFILK